jgi:hypothetical protein
MYKRVIISRQLYSPPIAPTCKPQNQWVLWDIIPCSLVDMYQHIRGTYCLHLKKKTPSSPQNLGICLQDNRSYTQKTHHHDYFKPQKIINFYLILWNLYTIWLMTLSRLKLHQACVVSQEKELHTGHLVLKVKVKCTLVEVLRLCTGRTAHRGSRGTALPFLDHGTRRDEGSASRPGCSLLPGKTWT